MEDPNLDPSYSRRLDRTPETGSGNLARLSDEDRRKIYGLRNAFGNTLNKLQRLEESNDEKELMIERERQLRKNLEDKLMETKLVDMYSDPAVNEELHERLPRAAMDRMYSIHGTPRHSRGKKNKKAKKGSISDEEYSGSDEEIQGRNHKHNHSFPGAMLHPAAYLNSPGMFGWHPGMMYPPPPFSHNQQSTPNNPGSSQPNPMQGFQPMMSTWYQNQAANTTIQNRQEVNGSGDHQADTGQRQHIDEVSVIKAASMLSVDSKERQIARLLHEIDLLKDQNRKLSEDLAEQITECNKLKVEKELRDVSTEEQISSRVSLLIQEIYEKQKQRDQAMMGRLRLANEERDKALMMVNSLKQGQSMTEILSDDEQEDSKTRQQMLSNLDIEHDTDNILDAIHGSANRTREMTSQRVRAITSERDAAQHKVAQLEMELLKVQRQIDEITPLQEDHLKVKKQLAMTQQERDMSLTKLRTLEEENNNLKIYYGLHKSLSKEQSWKEQYNNSLSEMQQLIAQRDGNVIDAQKETNKLQQIIQELTEERDILSETMEKLQASQGDDKKTNEKLQRHVNVLQKKLKKLSSGDQGTV